MTHFGVPLARVAKRTVFKALGIASTGHPRDQDSRFSTLIKRLGACEGEADRVCSLSDL